MHDLNKLRLGKSPNEVSNIETRQEVYDAVLEITCLLYTSDAADE